MYVLGDKILAIEAVVQSCSVKKVFLDAKFTGKHLCQSLFFKKGYSGTGVFL